MTPVLCEKWNQDELWQGLCMGDLVIIATDYCSFCMKEQKELGREAFTQIPNGASGVENRMSLIYNAGVGKDWISLNRFVELTSIAPAKAFGLFPKKGTIAVGSDADIVVFDPKCIEMISIDNPCFHHMNVDYSAYEGFEVTGWSEIVLFRGRVIVHKGMMETIGGGSFIKRARSNDLLR